MICFKELGNTEYNKNNYQTALDYYNLELKSEEKNNYIVYSNITSVYLKLNENAEALKAIKNSIRDNMSWFKSWKKLGEVLEKLCRYDEALVSYNRSLELLSLSNQKYDDIKIKLEESIDKLNDLTKTESENSDDSDNSDNSDNNSENNLDTSSESFRSSMFEKMMKNKNINDKLNNKTIQQKILDNKYNPFIIFKDPDIMDLMKEMYKEYKN